MSSPSAQPNVLVVFYSRGALTERLAVLVAEGALQGGANIRLRRARDTAPEDEIARTPGWLENRDRMQAEYAAPREADAEWADAILCGTPAEPGTVSAELMVYVDQIGSLSRSGKLAGKIGSAFSSTYAASATGETALAGLQLELLHLGLMVAPGPRANPHTIDGTHGRNLDYELAREHGRSLANLTRAIMTIDR
jgi:NAD(P)H dehydrogenase (quinone)